MSVLLGSGSPPFTIITIPLDGVTIDVDDGADDGGGGSGGGVCFTTKSNVAVGSLGESFTGGGARQLLPSRKKPLRSMRGRTTV